jgi:uncharacterized membrane protein
MLRNILELAGIVVFVLGLGLIYPPLGVVVAGFVLVIAAHSPEKAQGRNG